MKGTFEEDSDEEKPVITESEMKVALNILAR